MVLKKLKFLSIRPGVVFLSISLLSFSITLASVPEKHKKPHFENALINESFFGFPVPHHPQIKKWMKFFLSPKGLVILSSWMGRMQDDFLFVRSQVQRERLPLALSYLPFIESGFLPRARSHMGAEGYWQFIPRTARSYGLKVAWWIDERRHLHKSTQAAFRYLKKLYSDFGQWDLALAGYNMGEGKLKALIRRHKTKNFWKLSQKKRFPKETRNYVPKFVAIGFLLSQPALYNLKLPPSPVTKRRYSYIRLKGGTHLSKVAKYLNADIKGLLSMNPELKTRQIPYSVKNYDLKVSQSSFQVVREYFLAN